MVFSAGKWAETGMTCEIFEIASGHTFVAAYETEYERAERIKLIEEFASKMEEEEQTCSLCGHVFEQYTGKRNGWFYMRSQLTCGHSICVVCQLELVATALDHSLDGTCLPYDTFDKISQNVIPACIFGRQCTKAKLVCPSCKTIDTRNITEIPKDLGLEHVQVKGFELHKLVRRRLKPVKRQRVKTQNPSVKRQKTKTYNKDEKPWMRYKACHRSKICKLFGDCMIRHPAENPKRPGSVAAQRWEKYKHFKYVWEMFRHGFGSDVSYQLRRGQSKKAHLYIEVK